MEIQAHAATLAHERIEVEDVVVATLRFKSGALGVLAYALSTDRTLTHQLVSPTPQAPTAPPDQHTSRSGGAR